MRPGKVKASVKDRSVLRQLNKKSELDGRLTVHTVEGLSLAANRAVWGAAAKTMTQGGIPQSLSFSLLLPEDLEEKVLKGLMRDLRNLAQIWNMDLASSYVGVSPSIKKPILTTSCSSISGDGAIQGAPVDLAAEQAAGNKVSDLVVAGPVGMEGASLIATDKREELMDRYPAFFIDEAAGMFDPESACQLMRALSKLAVQEKEMRTLFHMHALGEGGIFAGLWDYAVAAKVGLEVLLTRIPVKQHTIEVCEFFDRNPYQIFSGGSVLIACHNGGRTVRKLQEAGIEADVIGHTTAGNDRIIRYGEEVRYLEPPKTDEYYFI